MIKNSRIICVSNFLYCVYVFLFLKKYLFDRHFFVVLWLCMMLGYNVLMGVNYPVLLDWGFTAKWIIIN